MIWHNSFLMYPSPETREEPKTSLLRRYPLFSVLINFGILLAAALLVQALTTPILYTEKMRFWKNTYSVWTGVLDLWTLGERALATVLFFFSIIFPFSKLSLLLAAWNIPLNGKRRNQLLHLLGITGKWSMLDVFVVAILIVLVKLGSLAKVEPRIGIYFFCAAILCSMILTMAVEHLSRKAQDEGAPKKP
jgi:paraquat-inducible protein A